MLSDGKKEITYIGIRNILYSVIFFSARVLILRTTNTADLWAYYCICIWAFHYYDSMFAPFIDKSTIFNNMYLVSYCYLRTLYTIISVGCSHMFCVVYGNQLCCSVLYMTWNQLYAFYLIDVLTNFRHQLNIFIFHKLLNQYDVFDFLYA